MGTSLVRRLLMAPLVLVVLASLSFVIMRLAPGGPFSSERGKLAPEVQHALEAHYHMDKPMWLQYLRFLGDLARLDLGESISTYKGDSVDSVLARTFPVSLLLGAQALALAVLLGIWAGVAAAMRRHGVADRATLLAGMLAISLPTFVVGPLLALLFGLWLHWLPIAGWQGFMHPAFQVLPAITLSLPFAGRIARLTRVGMLDVLGQEHIRTARAKGARAWRVALLHGLRLGIIPVVAFLGPATAAVLTGSLVIEMVFQIPGMGRDFVNSALNRDYTLVMGTVLVYGALLVLCNILADLAHALLDPRVRTA